jgi:hypothetical protein
VNLGVFEVPENMERETRIELATNSLEGCDSTIELLPLSYLFILAFHHTLDFRGSVGHWCEKMIACE